MAVKHLFGKAPFRFEMPLPRLPHVPLGPVSMHLRV